MTSIVIPVIDISPMYGDSSDAKHGVAMQIKAACEEVGFFVIKGHGIPDTIINNAWSAARTFFDLPAAEKAEYETKNEEEYPFGYSRLGGEVLSAGKDAEHGRENIAPPDFKEMFSLGPKDPNSGFPARIFPSNPASFESSFTEYYDAVNNLASRILEAFAIALELPNNYFDQFVDHHASALRALNYPALKGHQRIPGQSRASAHTDYGTITILRADGPGLQVSKDKDPPNWHDVPFIPDGFIINLGDLMKRWTNDKWLSTLHQVVIPDESNPQYLAMMERRQSMAFFHNLNRDALVSNITSEPSKYEPIIAGDFLMQKHLASVGGKKK